MKCPVCNETNHASDAFYCHNCGKKLRTKVNGWLVCSIILFLATVLLGFLAFNYADGMAYYKARQYELYQEKQAFSNQAIDKNSKISALNSEISRLNSEISQLKTELPQTYRTKYANQDIYYWNGTFRQTDYKYNKGTWVEIYVQKDGYGLTDWGWIPMNCLEKQ